MANQELDALMDKIAKALEPLKGAMSWMESNSPGDVGKAMLAKLGLTHPAPAPPPPPNMPGQPAMGPPQNVGAPPPGPPPAMPPASGPPNRYGQMAGGQ